MFTERVSGPPLHFFVREMKSVAEKSRFRRSKLRKFACRIARASRISSQNAVSRIVCEPECAEKHKMSRTAHFCLES